jgi:hypothetical protein
MISLAPWRPEVRVRVEAELRAIGADQSEGDCPVCGADYGPSTTYPWHWPKEDCRRIRAPEVGA